MALSRVNPRGLITLGNFSFANGEVRIASINDTPARILALFLIDTIAGLEALFEWNHSEGILSDDDYEFLDNLSADETGELVNKLNELYGHAPISKAPAGDGIDLAGSTGLSPEEEAEIQEFSAFLQGLATAHPAEPSEAPVQDDRGDDDGLAAV